jgi:hypothetical protein
MRKLVLLISIALAAACHPSAVWAYTLTFDDIPVGHDLGYYKQQYGFDAPGWEVIDSVASGWGMPHSGTQAVIWNDDPVWATAFGFFFVDGVSEYAAQSVGAYFTTAPGVVLQMRGYTARGAITATIGDANGTWVNRYVQMSSPTGILYVHIAGLSSPDARYHFSMDDLTVVPVPEPSSILALGFGLAAMGAMLRRRR